MQRITWFTDLEPPTIGDIIEVAKFNFENVPLDQIEIKGDKNVAGGSISISVRQVTELQKALKDYLEKNPGTERQIASQLGVMPGTIVRWMEGRTSPAPDVAQGVIQKLQKMEKEEAK